MPSWTPHDANVCFDPPLMLLCVAAFLRSRQVFEPPLDLALVEAIKASPDPNAQLLTMNIAMSTATELAHLANGTPVLHCVRVSAPCLVYRSAQSPGSQTLPQETEPLSPRR